MKPGRNMGIELLRIVAMFSVVCLHVLGCGGVYTNAEHAAYQVSWLMEIATYYAVDCYAIISGYVGYSEEERKYRYSRYVSVWLQVAFYNFVITLIASYMLPGTQNATTIAMALLPVSTNAYWYFGAYTGLFFVIPWINKFVRGCRNKQMNGYVALLFGVFSVYATLAKIWGVDVFCLYDG